MSIPHPISWRSRVFRATGHPLRTCWVALALLAAWPIAAAAQSETASLSGTVTDVSGGALPGAIVTLVPAPAGATRTVTTDAQGGYEFVALTAGEYRLAAELAGFARAEQRVALAAGERRTAGLTLTISEFAETVTVSITRSPTEDARVPQAISVIERDAIQSFQRRASPAEALVGVPGFFAENRRNFSLSGGVRLAIRAPLPRFGMRGVQIVQDGVPMTMADGTTEPTNIDLGSLGRVEVLRGPSSVLYGNSAGGVISLQTEFPAARPLTIEPDVQWGSYGYRQQQVKVAGTTRALSYLANVTRMESDGYRDHSRTDVRRANVVVRAAPAAKTEIRGVFNVYDLPFGESASTVTLAEARNNPRGTRPQAFTQGWGESTSQQQTGVTVQQTIAPGHLLRATAWGVWRDVYNPIPASIVSVDRRAAGLRSEYGGAAAAGAVPITWTTGVDISTQHDERNEFENTGVPAGGGLAGTGALRLAQIETVRSVSPFVHLTASLGARWHVTGGVRYDRFLFRADDRFLSDGDQSGDRTLDAVSPMIGATFVPAGWLTLYSNLATAYQTPTTVELSNRPTNEGGFNPELGPEDLRSFEVGARSAIAPLRLRLELAAYASSIDDSIVRFQRADERAYFRNAGEVSRRGLEILAEWLPSTRVKGRVAYTHQRFRYGRFVAPEGDFSNRVEPGAPPHQLVIGGTYQAPGGVFTAVNYRFIDAYPVNSQNTVDNWAYQVVDVRLGLDRRWKGLRLRPFVTFDNIFDERYNSSAIVNSIGDRFFEPSPGREIAAGLTLGVGRF